MVSDKRRSLDTWCRIVFAARRLPDSSKVLLLWMSGRSKETRSGRVVCEPRKVMADALGIAERRVDERIKAARDHGFLLVVRPGYRGHVAEYALSFPDESARESVAHSGAECASPTSALSVSESVAHTGMGSRSELRERARESVAPLVSGHPTSADVPVEPWATTEVGADYCSHAEPASWCEACQREAAV